MRQIKKNSRLFDWVFFFFTFLVPWLRFRRRIRVILWFSFALEFWTTSGQFKICASVRRLSFPRDLSAPMFHWNWHCTQVFSQISLINSAVMNTDYSIFLHTLRNFLAILRFSGSPCDRPWDGIPNHESHGQTVRVGRSLLSLWNKGVQCHLWNETTLFVLNSFKSAEVILKSNII